jgi:C-terminal processing protease CtpA/Prc
MRKLGLAIAVCVLAASTFAQQAPQNLGFELGSRGEFPRGWFFTTQSGYTAKLTDQNPKKGALCAVIELTGQAQPNDFANLSQAADATPYRGKEIRFKAAVRTESVGKQGRAQMWLSVYRQGGAIGFYDQMNDRPILSTEWSYYEIVGDVEEDAQALNFGIMAFGKGSVWVDDVSIEILGNTVKLPAEAARPVDEGGLRNLIAFSRLFGYVRHFYPSNEAARTDWESFAIDGVRAVEGAKNSSELAEILASLFRPVAPKVQVYLSNNAPQVSATVLPPGNQTTVKVKVWRHHGFGTGAQGSIYKSNLLIVEMPAAKVPKPYEADLGSGLRCRVPLALFVGAGETEIPHPPATKKRTGDDRATRLADVILAWNVFQHFYPYFDVVKTDWPAALEIALKSAATDRNGPAFVYTLRRLVAALHDGHGHAFSLVNGATYPLPVLWDWIEDRLVITNVPKAQGQDIAKGDFVIAINGKPVAQALADTESLISGATPQWILFNALREVGLGNKDEQLTFEIESYGKPGKSHQVILKRDVSPMDLAEPRPERIKELEPGIFYVDPGRTSDDDWNKALPQLSKASGIVFDMRGYPTLSPSFLSHLSEKSMTSAQWHIPNVAFPDRKDLQFERSGEWNLPPRAPYLAARKAFITDGRAISYAESCMGIVEYYKLGEIVGGPTAGTNGDINPFTLPGGYTLIWTGTKVLKHDGSQHHGVGIRPTIPVSRTRAGVAAGRDELLERAVQAVK